MTSEIIHCVASVYASSYCQLEVQPYGYSHLYNKIFPQWLIDCQTKKYGAAKKGVPKQSRIKSSMWHLRWLVRTRADITVQ